MPDECQIYDPAALYNGINDLHLFCFGDTGRLYRHVGFYQHQLLHYRERDEVCDQGAYRHRHGLCLSGRRCTGPRRLGSDFGFIEYVVLEYGLGHQVRDSGAQQY